MAVPKRRVGRPLAFATPEELEQKIDGYFEWCDSRTAIKHDKEGNTFVVPWPRPYTLSGLAVWLDVDRGTLLNYSKDENFFSTISRARRKCEAFAHEQLFDGNDRGAKFSLINNHDEWHDKQEVEHTGDMLFSIRRPDDLLTDASRPALDEGDDDVIDV